MYNHNIHDCGVYINSSVRQRSFNTHCAEPLTYVFKEHVTSHCLLIEYNHNNYYSLYCACMNLMPSSYPFNQCARPLRAHANLNKHLI